MSQITILARGKAALPFAGMLARALTEAGHTAAVAETPTGRETYLVADADSVPDLPDVEHLLCYTADPARADAHTLVRPFRITEFLARFPRPVLTLASARPAIERLVFTSDGDVTFDGTSLGLAKKEAALLRYLYARRGEVCTREELVEGVWNHLYTGNTNLVDVYVRYIRAKLDEKYNMKLLYAVRGKGYMLK